MTMMTEIYFLVLLQKRRHPCQQEGEHHRQQRYCCRWQQNQLFRAVEILGTVQEYWCHINIAVEVKIEEY